MGCTCSSQFFGCGVWDGESAPCFATERLRAPAVSVKAGMDNDMTRLGLGSGVRKTRRRGRWERVERLGGGRQSGGGGGGVIEGQCETLRAAEPG
jgi:hypothetical protein